MNESKSSTPTPQPAWGLWWAPTPDDAGEWDEARRFDDPSEAALRAARAAENYSRTVVAAHRFRPDAHPQTWCYPDGRREVVGPKAETAPAGMPGWVLHRSRVSPRLRVLVTLDPVYCGEDIEDAKREGREEAEREAS